VCENSHEKKKSKWTGANPWVNNILTLLEPTCDKPIVTTSIEWYMGVAGEQLLGLILPFD
jgi:hypothetical protein